MGEPIKPALTTEEWALRPVGDAGWSKSVPIIQVIRGQSAIEAWPQPDGHMVLSVDEDVTDHMSREGAASIAEELRHATAALALSGQPFGFTREDVAQLRTAAREARAGYSYRAGYPEWCNSLADRIEALLPPEQNKSMADANGR